jgi:predicted amidophosphoribosyltransferase
MIRHFINFTYPPRCAGCERRLWLQSGRRVCADCIRSIQSLGEPLCEARGVPIDLATAAVTHGWCRGCAEAALIGATIARRLGRPLDVRTLIRTRATPSQTAQDRRARLRNIHDAFAVRRPARVANRRVLLVDVMTTGATVDECARTLIAAGARWVDVLALAWVL